MKSILVFSFLLLLLPLVHAQAPDKFNYQAVARDQNGQVITGEISIRLSFKESNPSGTNRYVETHTVTTDPQGIFALTIGTGAVVSGDFSTIDWADHDYFLKVEMKTPAESNYTEMGTTQLLSVPYAKYAETSGDALKEGTGIHITNGAINNTGDLSNTNEIQNLTVNGNQLSISDGNTVTLPTGTTYTAGSGIQINGNSISAQDPSPTNEIQTLSLNGQQLSLSNGGGSVQLPSAASSWTVNNTDITSTPSSNNVVIGTNSNFNSKLYVSSTGSQIAGNFTSPGSGDAVRGYSNGNGSGVAGSSLSGTGGTFTSVSGKGGYFSSNSGPALITGTGNVGIGISNPGYKLTVMTDSGTGIYTKSMDGTGLTAISGGLYSGGWFHSATGPAISLNSDSGYAISALQGAYGTAASTQGILMSMGPANWKMYVDFALDYNFAYNGVIKAWISDTDGSYHNSSDRNLKKDIVAFDHVLPKLNSLQAYTYHMKDAPEDAPLSLGFMAQDVEQQFPELVAEKAGYKSLCYDHFAVLAVQAVKEQQVLIEDLQHDNADMKQELTELKQLVLTLMGKK